MSTLPGSETWRDAGLDQVDPGGDVEIAPEAIDDPAAEPDEYAPEPPLPDVVTEANPADVTEQAQTVPPDEREEYP
ncbi:hypothetical protein [Cellulomonas sp. ATA003]|uniref:hypothetical protein n=1 Tax=Cellulomonas sp. ATA003 TaxID=3073064 RepID=UPI00287389DE|nr:hypothetical protein [Cellulomonas sp. ATA003]WNB84989.1 hypothetical protein REH70_15045 [Cellulomonas sp. ATA003]